MSRPHVLIISTGGTIASQQDPTTGETRVADSGQALLAAVPGLDDIADISMQSTFNKLSSLITPTDVQTLARQVSAALADEQISGIVITHGTDTMEESAFLLDLLITPRDKTVVLTGAQLSADMLGSDGPRNLYQAVRVAASDAARGCGVVVAFADSILSARDVTKSHTSRLETFVSSRGTRLGEIRRDQVKLHARPLPRPTYQVGSLTQRIPIFHLGMGMEADWLDAMLEQGVDGLVIAAFGIGNAGPAICQRVEQARQAGVPTLIASRCGAGAVAPVYAHGGGVDLVKAGALMSKDLAPEKARLALMVLLGAGTSQSDLGTELARIAN